MFDNSEHRLPFKLIRHCSGASDPGFFGNNEPKSLRRTHHASPLNLRRMIVIVPN